MGACPSREDGKHYTEIQSSHELNETKSAIAPKQYPPHHSINRTSTLHQSALIGIVKSYIHYVQIQLFSNVDHSPISPAVTHLILQYLRGFTFYNIFGIGKYVVNDGESKTFERLHEIERRLISPSRCGLFRGHNKYFIRSFSEIYGVGSNALSFFTYFSYSESTETVWTPIN